LRSGATHEVLTGETMKELYGISVTLLQKKGRYWPIPD
jgi:hypothetical protein